MAVFTEPTQWSHTLGNNADVSTLPDDTPGTTGLASLQKLFQTINQVPLEAGGVAPDRSDFNALFKILGDSIFYMQNGGVWSYNALFDYPVGAFVMYNGYFYKCVQTNGPGSTVVTPGSDTAYWVLMITEADIVGMRVPAGTSMEWTSPNLPTGYLWENGAEYDEGDYADLFAEIGYRYGSTTATKAAGTLGEAFIPGAAGNNIRITVATSGSSFLVSTYVSSDLVDSQLVTSAAELENHGYVVFDSSATLTNGTDETLSGGADGTSFKVPDRRNRYGIGAGNNPLGAYLAEQLPNITGDFWAWCPYVPQVNGAFNAINLGGWDAHSGSGGTMSKYEFDASRSNSTYINSGKVYPLSLALNFIIKT